MLAGLNFPGTNIWLGMAVLTASCVALEAVIVRKIRGPLTAAELVALSRPALEGSRRDWVR